jgi:hypothetical protein
MSLITGNKVKKTHKPRYCEKEKYKANKRILRNLSFDNNGLVMPYWKVYTVKPELRGHPWDQEKVTL